MRWANKISEKKQINKQNNCEPGNFQPIMTNIKLIHHIKIVHYSQQITNSLCKTLLIDKKSYTYSYKRIYKENDKYNL